MRWTLTNQSGGFKLWFAWYPVLLEDSMEYAWLERVWRYAEQTDSDPMRWRYERYVGEKRQLDPKRLIPSDPEILGACTLAEAYKLEHEPDHFGTTVDAISKHTVKKLEGWPGPTPNLFDIAPVSCIIDRTKPQEKKELEDVSF